jgi:hypothetical protein
MKLDQDAFPAIFTIRVSKNETKITTAFPRIKRVYESLSPSHRHPAAVFTGNQPPIGCHAAIETRIG